MSVPLAVLADMMEMTIATTPTVTPGTQHGDVPSSKKGTKAMCPDCSLYPPFFHQKKRTERKKEKKEKEMNLHLTLPFRQHLNLCTSECYSYQNTSRPYVVLSAIRPKSQKLH